MNDLRKMLHDHRGTRQEGLVPSNFLMEPMAIIGCGAVGRQVALMLAAMGVEEITLHDFDRVGIENLAVQGFYEKDLGELKTDACKEIMLQINQDVEVHTVNEVAGIKTELQPIIFCCVDSMAGRRDIWGAWKKCSKSEGIFVDSRLGAGVLRVVSDVGGDAGGNQYLKSWYSDEDAEDLGCTARSTIYQANIVAGLVISQAVQAYRGALVPLDYLIDLNNLMLIEMPENLWTQSSMVDPVPSEPSQDT